MILIMNCAAWAQWINVSQPNIPRTPDGKPNLTAPTPKTADGRIDRASARVRGVRRVRERRRSIGVGDRGRVGVPSESLGGTDTVTRQMHA